MRLKITIIALFGALSVLAISFILLNSSFFTKNEPSVSESQVIDPTANPTPTKNRESNLRDIIESVNKETKDSYAIVVKNLKSGESYYSNEHKVFSAGSLYKLWVMTAVYDFIEQGKLKDTTVLSASVETLNDSFNIASEDAELKEGTITYTVSDALREMITASDNYAALLLSRQVRLTNVDKLLKVNGLTESKLGLTGGLPTVTASDVALFFEKLYKGNLIAGKHKDDMINLLKEQQINHKIPKYLPSSIEIAHKTGELSNFSHDAGIVFSQKGDYIIVILSESNIPQNAEEFIAKISKSVYDYFEKTKT